MHIVSIVTGVTQEYQQETIKKIFGTPEDPTVGTFYNIQDSDISNIVENNVYNDITATFEQPIHDITIKDSFLKETLENFTFDFVENSKHILVNNFFVHSLQNLGLVSKFNKDRRLKKSYTTNDFIKIYYKEFDKKE